MSKFAYLVNPISHRFYESNNIINKIKLNLPQNIFSRMYPFKLTDIYDKKSKTIGHMIAIPYLEEGKEIEFNKLFESAVKLANKLRVDAICLGDFCKNSRMLKDKKNNKILDGKYGYTTILMEYIEKAISILNKDISDCEFVILTNEYDSLSQLFINQLANKAKYITIVTNDNNINKHIDEIFLKTGTSVYASSSVSNVITNADLVIDFDNRINNIVTLNTKDNLVYVLPFVEKINKYITKSNLKIINNIGMLSSEVIVLNKLSIIQNFYSPELIEALAFLNRYNLYNNLTHQERIDEVKSYIANNDYHLTKEEELFANVTY